VGTTPGRLRVHQDEFDVNLRREPFMSSAKTFDLHCPKCNENTSHIPVPKGFARTAVKTVKIATFIISFGMLYPYILTENGDSMVACAKCGVNAKISNSTA